MGWFLFFAIGVFSIWWWRAANKARVRKQVEDHAAAALLREEDYAPRKIRDPTKPGWSESSSVSLGSKRLVFTASTREYDPNKYRFDGIAYPEWRIEYADEDGSVTEREIYVHRWNDRGPITYFECWCYLRDERRTFRSDRILEARNLNTNRKVKSIRAYVMR